MPRISSINFLILCNNNYFKMSSKLQIRCLSKLRNNFTYKRDIQKALEEEKKKSFFEKRIVSSDIVLGKKYDVNKSRKEKKYSPLQYKGELLFGIHPVYMALFERRRKFHQLFVKNEDEISTNSSNNSRKAEIVEMARSLGIPINNVNTKGLNYLVPGTVHQGICLDAGPLQMLEWKETESQLVTSTEIPLLLVLDEILDPMNVGAIMRSAHYFGVKKLFVMLGNSCKLSPTVSKASSGALEVMDIYQIENLEYFLQIMKSKQWKIISAVPCTENQNALEITDVSKYTLRSPTILILGNESRGISTANLALCDNVLSIYPLQTLHTGIDSLNVSVAAGIILHLLTKSWKDAVK